MAINELTVVKNYQGLASDTKPTDATAFLGARFRELDTGNPFVFDGTVWQPAAADFGALIVPATTITTAITGQVLGTTLGLAGLKYVAAQAVFTYGSGGTTANFYVQTSLDQGATWIDIMNFSFTTSTATKVSAVVWTTALAAAATPTDGSLTANTILSGLLGDRVRVKGTTTGTYAGGTTIAISIATKG